MKKIILGSQVSFKEPEYLEGAVKQIVSFGGNAMMFFVGPPQRFKQTDILKFDVELFNKLLKKHKIDTKNIFIHASYLINFGNTIKKHVHETSIEILTSICERAVYIGVKNIIIHPGSSLKENKKESLLSLINGLDNILSKYKNINIHLETMSGKGSEIGTSFEELNFIIEGSKNSERLFVCWDTCHLFSFGYNIRDHLDDVLNEFDEKIGLNKLKVLHLNDSLKPLGSKKDRHANIGKGLIGLEPLKKIVHHIKLRNVVKLLETPYVDGFPLYKQEIKMLLK